MTTPVQVVVMGVSGCGKTSVGVALGKALGLRFIDGDDLHPQANRDKMAAGIPLTDEDRWPWLELVGETLANSTDVGTAVACSALKRVYRDRILAAAPNTFFVHLHGTRELLAERMGQRKNHFMPLSLLDSQLNTLEPLGADEPGVVLDIALPLDEIVAQAVSALERA